MSMPEPEQERVLQLTGISAPGDPATAAGGR
jgi:hypothetical protein